ncbi:MAG: InlB B-repeat-containing protein [Oscillospiraceae bacterium]
MKVKGKISIFLALVITIVLMNGIMIPASATDPSGNWIDYATEPTLSSTTYTITSAQELAWVADQVNNQGSNFDGYIIKIADYTAIDLGAHEWTPIGTLSNSFSGTFDGNDNTISNMTIGTSSSPSSLTSVGLIGSSSATGIIENVKMENITIITSYTVGSNYVGGIAGKTFGGTISNCSTSGNINGNLSDHVLGNYSGGIVGYSLSNIDQCSSSVNIAYAGILESYAGGLVGYFSADIGSTRSITNCYATGTVSGEALMFAGGLIGLASGNGTTNVYDSYATGNITCCKVKTSVAGGLIGDSFANIENCFATGDVTAYNYAGGFIGGYVWGNISNSFATGNASIKKADSSAVGEFIGGATSDYSPSSISNCYASGNISRIPFTPGGCFIGSFQSSEETDLSSLYSNIYWNKDATLTVLDGAVLGSDYKVGINYTSDPSTAKSGDEMTSASFAELLNTNKQGDNARSWTSVCGINGGYPYLEGLYYTTPTTTHTVTFYSDSNTSYKVVNVADGDTVGAPGTAPTKHLDNFVGWYTSSDLSTPFDFGTSITANTEIYAKWEAKPTYTVAYNLNGGSGTVPTDGSSYVESDPVELASGDGLTKDGYIFGGWKVSSTVYSAGSYYTMGTENVTFYANWKQTHTVTYYANNGTDTSLADENVYAEGDSFTLASVYDGWTNGSLNFAGWVDEYGSFYSPGDSYEVYGGDVALYARWTDYWTDEANNAIESPALDEDTNTYTIENAAQLAWVADQVNNQGSDFYGYTIKIADSVSVIDLGAHDWNPIGNDDTYFCGTFDGNYKKIVNLKIATLEKPNGDLYEAGLFGYVEHASISNIRMEDTSIYSSCDYPYIGCIVGYGNGSSITNCFASGTVSSSGEDTCIGGISGEFDDGSISNCGAEVNVTGGDYSYVGGSVGYVYATTISDSYAAGNIAGGDDAYVGGLFGDIYDITATNCYATGDVAGGEYSYVGSFIGYEEDASSISHAYWNSDASQTIIDTTVDAAYKVGIGYGSGSDEDSLTPKTSEYMKSSDFAALLETNKNESAAGVWTIISGVNSGYPVLANTVTFDKNDGDTDANPTTLAVALFDNTGTLPTAPTRSGYTFNGWNSLADGNGVPFTANTEVSADITVYAQWAVKTSSGSSGDFSVSTPKITVSGNTATITIAPTTSSSGIASSAVTQSQISNTLAKAKDAAETNDGEPYVEIKVEDTSDVDSAELTIPTTSIDSLADGNLGGLTVSTGLGSVTFGSAALSTISNSASGSVTFSVALTDTSVLPDSVQQAVGTHPVYDFTVTSGGNTISQFGGPVTVSIPYTPFADEDINAIIVYYINDDGGLETVTNGYYDAATGTVVFSATHFSTYAVVYNKVSFTDVSESAWYADAVNFLAARGITGGTTETTFSPNATLNRGQFITLVMRAYGIEPEENATDNFSDAGNTYYTGYLAAAKQLGISNGVGNNRFAPEQAISRQQMFTLLYNTLKEISQLPEGDSGKSISDFTDGVSVSSYAQEALNHLVNAGVVSGNNGCLLPSATATRAQMAQVLYNLLQI